MQSMASASPFMTRSLSFRGARHSQFQAFSRPSTYGAHSKDLGRLASKLAAISSALKAESGSLEAYQYTAALLEAVQALRQICRRYHEKSQGNVNKYPMAEYNANLKTYEGLMNKCQALGVALNRRIRDERV